MFGWICSLCFSQLEKKQEQMGKSTFLIDLGSMSLKYQENISLDRDTRQAYNKCAIVFFQGIDWQILPCAFHVLEDTVILKGCLLTWSRSLNNFWLLRTTME